MNQTLEPLEPSDRRGIAESTSVWNPKPLGARALAGSIDVDLCVVGLGGSGLGAVLRALDFGMTVAGIDATSVASGAAGRNGGFLLAGPAHFHHEAHERFGTDAAARFYQHTIEGLVSMERVSPSVRRVGSLRIAASDTEREDIERHLASLLDDGFEAERYVGPEGDGLLVPGDCVFDPAAWCRERAEEALERGAALFESTPAERLEPGRVETPAGTIRCSDVVVAVDGGLEDLFPQLRDRVTTWRLQMLATAPVGRVVTRRAVYHRFGLDYWQQLPDGGIALGGARDVGGEAERRAPDGTTPEVQDALERLLRDKLGVSSAVTRRWSGRVSYTDNGLPVCEQVQPRVHALGAYSGTGNVIGSLCGRGVIERIHGMGSPFLDLLDDMRSRAHEALTE